MSLTANTVLVVRFQTGRTYTHAVGDDREAQNTVEAWQRAQGLWVIEPESRARMWCPWHTVTEVVLPRPPHAGVVGGRGPAVRRETNREARPEVKPATKPEGGQP